jgi:hypothetical protein
MVIHRPLLFITDLKHLYEDKTIPLLAKISKYQKGKIHTNTYQYIQSNPKGKKQKAEGRI